MAGDGHGGAGHDIRDEIVDALAKTERIVAGAGRAPSCIALDRRVRHARVVDAVDRDVAELEVVVVCRMVRDDAVELVGDVRHVHNHGQAAIVEISVPHVLCAVEVTAAVRSRSLCYLHGRAAKSGRTVVRGGHVVPGRIRHGVVARTVPDRRRRIEIRTAREVDADGCYRFDKPEVIRNVAARSRIVRKGIVAELGRSAVVRIASVYQLRVHAACSFGELHCRGLRIVVVGSLVYRLQLVRHLREHVAIHRLLPVEECYLRSICVEVAALHPCAERVRGEVGERRAREHERRSRLVDHAAIVGEVD